MRWVAVVTGSVTVSACTPGEVQPEPPAAEQVRAAAQPRPPAAPEPGKVAGAWRIVSIDGAPPSTPVGEGDRERTPHIRFTGTGYGGTVGCNFFGGLGLLESGRYYTLPGPQTAMGCGELSREEQAVTETFRLAPHISFAADGALLLMGEKHRVVLRRDAALEGSAPPAPEAAAPPALAGSAWLVRSVDGKLVQGTAGGGRRMLRLAAGSWSGTAACATLSGPWRQSGDRLVLTAPPTTTEQKCRPDAAELDRRLGAIMTASPRFVVGPNGEILIAAGGHWLIADRIGG